MTLEFTSLANDNGAEPDPANPWFSRDGRLDPRGQLLGRIERRDCACGLWPHQINCPGEAAPE